MRVKKIIATMAALTLMSNIVAYSEIDWASMDDATIQAEIKNAQDELAKRNGSSSVGGVEGAVIFDAEGVKATVQSYGVGDYMGTADSLKIDFLVENTSSKDMGFSPSMVSINGWEVDYVCYVDIAAGHKSKERILLLLSDANISSIDEVETVELAFTYPDENYDYHQTDTVTLKFK